MNGFPVTNLHLPLPFRGVVEQTWKLEVCIDEVSRKDEKERQGGGFAGCDAKGILRSTFVCFK